MSELRISDADLASDTGDIGGENLGPNNNDGQENKDLGNTNDGQGNETSGGYKAPADIDPDVEKLARESGWRPQDEYKGDNWVDAKTFVERGENILALVKADRDRQKKELAELKATQDQFKEFVKKNADADKARLVAELNELKAQRAEAISNGDGAQAVELEDRIDAAKTAMAETKTEAIEPKQQVAQHFTDWLAENTWMNNDVALRGAADAIGMDLVKQRPELMGTRELLDEVSKKIKDSFPEKFNRNSARSPFDAPSSSTTRRVGGNSNGSGYRDLPTALKQQADSFAAQGLMSKDEYAKDVFSNKEMYKEYFN